MSENVNYSSEERNKRNIVERILEQGQRLRNAMVKSILDGDPCYIDTEGGQFDYKKETSPNLVQQSGRCFDITSTSNRTLHPTGTSPLLNFPPSCNCSICRTYKEALSRTGFDLHSIPTLETNANDQRRFKRDVAVSTAESTNYTEREKLSEDMTKTIQDSYRNKCREYFKYVNSLKITIHSLTLNQAGNRKVIASFVNSKYKLPTSYNHSYFIEYSVPKCLIISQARSAAKIDTGLSGNLFRICSKRLQDEEVHFKHTSIHDVVNLSSLDLDDIEIKIQVSCRTMKQKQTNVLGHVTFKMSSFEVTKSLSCSQGFPLVDDNGFVLGALKMTLQLGCGRMYFGKEFIDFFVENNRKDLEGDVRNRDTFVLEPPPPLSSGRDASTVITTSKGRIVGNYSDNSSPHVPRKQIIRREESDKPPPPPTIEQEPLISVSEGSNSRLHTNRSSTLTIKENTNFTRPSKIEMKSKILLYGLIYISEAEYFRGPINSYLSCQLFSQGDVVCSRIAYKEKEPIFNFYQKAPYLLDDTFLVCLRDKSISIDFWERCETEDTLVGCCSLSLHQFYVAYRDETIVDTLIQNQFPIIISDWWEPICSPIDGKLYGQMKILVALGTDRQIRNLEVDRGLKDNSLSVTYVPIVPDAIGSSRKERNIPLQFKRPDYLKTPIKEPKRTDRSLKKTTTSKPLAKIDVGTQSNIAMESLHHNGDNSQTLHKNALEQFLARLAEQKLKNVCVENATNTEHEDYHQNNADGQQQQAVTESLAKLNQCKDATNQQLRKTSDLLDYLNSALTTKEEVHGLPRDLCTIVDDENTFEAHVVIEGALHLPSDKHKSKSKRGKRKHESKDGLPNTYVTFETVAGAHLKVTPIVKRSTHPKWNYQCDVTLPTEYLTNHQKRLIFKVWRQTNTSMSHPNLQSDVVIGFAALDLTVLVAGLPIVQGWFNIVDFSSKCNGQIKIHVKPLEEVSRLGKAKIADPSPALNQLKHQDGSASMEVQETGELLSRALKRKFVELEEITQRLRTRLADITGNDSDQSDDEFADEFERDINTCAEENCDEEVLGLLHVDVGSKDAEEISPLNVNTLQLAQAAEAMEPLSIHSAGTSVHSAVSEMNFKTLPTNPINRELIEGKQRIDFLLEKLSLLTNNSGDSSVGLSIPRHVSGCSIDINNDKANETKPNNFGDVFNKELLNQLCAAQVDSEFSTKNNSGTSSDTGNCSSSSSLLTQYSTYRQAPDGAGNDIFLKFCRRRDGGDGPGISFNYIKRGAPALRSRSRLSVFRSTKAKVVAKKGKGKRNCHLYPKAV